MQALKPVKLRQSVHLHPAVHQHSRWGSCQSSHPPHITGSIQPHAECVCLCAYRKQGERQQIKKKMLQSLYLRY